MSEKDDFVPAFPVSDTSAYNANPGMSLRAYVATKAMQSLIAKLDRDVFADDYFDDNVDAIISVTAAIYADALLAELAK